MTCPFYLRWWHRLLRKLDRRLTLPALAKFPAFFEAWEMFKAQHSYWSCPCAQADLLERLRKGLEEL